MTANTLIVITGYSSIAPRPWRKAYLNITLENAYQRFLNEYPNARDTSDVSISFEDEFAINTRGEISPN